MPNILPDPQLVLKRWNGTAYVDVAANDNWGESANVADIIQTSARVYAFGLEAGSADAVLLVDLQDVTALIRSEQMRVDFVFDLLSGHQRLGRVCSRGQTGHRTEVAAGPDQASSIPSR